jgi:hypothetical protein
VLFLCPKAGEISGKGNRKIKCSGRPRLYWISKWNKQLKPRDEKSSIGV